MTIAAVASSPDPRERPGDPLLEPLRLAVSDEARTREIEHVLVRVARPLAEQILSRSFRAGSVLRQYDADDILSTVMLRLVSRLGTLERGEQAPIDDFQSYVASLTYNTIHTFLRELFPQRTRLMNRLRYVLTHDDRLALWTAADDLLSGLHLWSRAPAPPPQTPVLSRRSATPAMLDERNPASAVVAMFQNMGHPVTLDALAELAAELWGIHDRPALKVVATPDPQPSVLLMLERREFVALLWREIRSLRQLQRKALLLNLRDGETINVLGLFVATGIANTSELAAVLDMSHADLGRIWNELPLPDTRIADLMQITRQQVINLRKAARKRLVRRLLQSGGS